MSNPETEQAEAIVDLFANNLVNKPISVPNSKDATAMNSLDPKTRTDITFDMFCLMFFQGIFKDPLRGLDENGESKDE